MVCLVRIVEEGGMVAGALSTVGRRVWLRAATHWCTTAKGERGLVLLNTGGNRGVKREPIGRGSLLKTVKLGQRLFCACQVFVFMAA